MKWPARAVSLLALAPEPAQACATCISSAFGDQTYNWAYVGLILLPFVLVATVGGILAYHAGYRPRAVAQRLAARVASKDGPQTIKETT